MDRDPKKPRRQPIGVLAEPDCDSELGQFVRLNLEKMQREHCFICPDIGQKELDQLHFDRRHLIILDETWAGYVSNSSTWFCLHQDGRIERFHDDRPHSVLLVCYPGENWTVPCQDAKFTMEDPEQDGPRFRAAVRAWLGEDKFY